MDKLFENVQTAIVLARNDGTVIRANKEFLRLFGYSRHEIPGKTVDMLVVPKVQHTTALSITEKEVEGKSVFFKQVYEVDPLQCPKCGAQMKIIAFIFEREEFVRILKHLAMWPIEYPEIKAAEARASPLDLKLLEKFSISSHLK